MSRRAYHSPRRDDTPSDAGTLGIWQQVAALSELEAWRQWSTLRTAPPSLRALAGTRLAALRARIVGEVQP